MIACEIRLDPMYDDSDLYKFTGKNDLSSALKVLVDKIIDLDQEVSHLKCRINGLEAKRGR